MLSLNGLISEEINNYTRLIIEEATVASYNKKDGTVGHKLLRLSGIPKDGTPIMDDEYYY